MSKKTAAIIIIVFVLLIAGGFLAFYFYANQDQDNNIVGPESRGNIFPTSPAAGGAQTQGGAAPSPQPPAESGTRAAPVLKELSERPSAGAVALAASSTVLVRFVERGTGNVYEVGPARDGETRLSNTTVPKIEEVLWHKDGRKVILRYAGDDGDSIKTYSASLAAKASGEAEDSLQGAFLTENIRAVAANPDQNKLFYLLQDAGGSTGIIAEFDGARKTQIFDSLLQEWLVAWPTPTTVALTSKPSAGVPGFLFLLNTRTGALTRAISGIKGLTARVSPTGSLVLYGESLPQGLSLKIYPFSNASLRETAVATLPEKCLWSKNDPGALYCSVPSYLPTGNYPDDWYKGLVAFSDDIWKIDSRTGAGELLAKLKDNTAKDIDGINLFMSPREDYLFFINKNDFHLWSLRIQN
ncbi:MAG: hypothetical protein HYV67_03790 [Candidatus Taylorbacteria bacterium]|nr:hypothetical protein [Candidatus Taylorbacteria bacterium]